MKQKIAAEKKPRLVSEETEMGYPTLTKLQSKEKGMRTELLMENGEKLTIYTLNKTG